MVMDKKIISRIILLTLAVAVGYVVVNCISEGVMFLNNKWIKVGGSSTYNSNERRLGIFKSFNVSKIGNEILFFTNNEKTIVAETIKLDAELLSFSSSFDMFAYICKGSDMNSNVLYIYKTSSPNVRFPDVKTIIKTKSSKIMSWDEKRIMCYSPEKKLVQEYNNNGELCEEREQELLLEYSKQIELYDCQKLSKLFPKKHINKKTFTSKKNYTLSIDGSAIVVTEDSSRNKVFIKKDANPAFIIDFDYPIFTYTTKESIETMNLHDGTKSSVPFSSFYRINYFSPVYDKGSPIIDYMFCQITQDETKLYSLDKDPVYDPYVYERFSFNLDSELPGKLDSITMENDSSTIYYAYTNKGIFKKNYYKFRFVD